MARVPFHTVPSCPERDSRPWCKSNGKPHCVPLHCVAFVWADLFSLKFTSGLLSESFDGWIQSWLGKKVWTVNKNLQADHFTDRIKGNTFRSLCALPDKYELSNLGWPCAWPFYVDACWNIQITRVQCPVPFIISPWLVLHSIRCKIWRIFLLLLLALQIIYVYC